MVPGGWTGVGDDGGCSSLVETRLDSAEPFKAAEKTKGWHQQLQLVGTLCNSCQWVVAI